jgi:TRAP-type transport system periplasmic protein
MWTLKCALLFLVLATHIPQAKAADAETHPLTIICSTDNPAGSPHVVVLQKFAQLVEQYSGGQLKAAVHYRDNPQRPAIRGEEVNVNMLVSGRENADTPLHITVVAAGNAAQKIEPLGFLMLPYLFKDTESAKKLFTSHFMTHELNTQIANTYHARSLGWLIDGFRHMTNARRPVRRLADLSGLRIRLPANRIMVLTYENLGATAIPMNWADVPAALNDSVIDGQENPYNVIAYSRFWEAGQKYLTENGPFLWTGPLLISEPFFERLSPQQQAIVQRAGQEAVMAQWQWTEQQTEQLKQQLISNGMQINELEDKPEWVRRSLELWPQQYELIGAGSAERGRALVDQALKQME